MKKLTALVLVFVFVLSFAGCKGQSNNNNTFPDPTESQDFNGIKINSNILAWTGEFSDERLKSAIIEYQNNYSNVVFKNKEEASCVSFEVDFEISSCTISRLSLTNNSDIEVELNGYIDLAIQTECDNKNVTIYTDWWYSIGSSSVKDDPVWSYLVRFEDTEDIVHYYYFRTDYSALLSQSNSK